MMDKEIKTIEAIISGIATRPRRKSKGFMGKLRIGKA
jgi:hypothetical protein